MVGHFVVNSIGFFAGSYRKIEKAHKTNTQTKEGAKMKLNKIDELVIKTLKTEGKELTLQELADKTGETQKKIFKSLRKLFEKQLIETNARKYKLTGKTPQSGKEEEPEPPEE